MAPHSSTLAWKMPWTEEPGRLQFMGSLKSWTWLSDFTFTFYFHALEKEMAAHSSVLAWRIPGMGEPGGLPSMGSRRVRHDWSDLAVAAADDSKGGEWKSWLKAQHSQIWNHDIFSNHFMANRWGNTAETVADFIFGGLQNHCRWWLQPWN